MIWLYIIGAIVAQAIVVVLLTEYINRRTQFTPAQQPREEPPSDPDPTSVVETKEHETSSVPQVVPEDNAVGVSQFSMAELRAMMEDVVKPIRECVETLMDEKDAEFEVKNEVPAPSKRMSAEQEAKAWEDQRDVERQLDKEDDTVAPPNPLATGVDFDSITQAASIVESPENQPVGALQFAMNVFRTVDGTQFSGCLPDALLEKLYECHRRVEMNEALREEESETETVPAEAIPAKEAEPMPQIEEKPEPKPEPVIEPEVKEAPAPRFRMSFLHKPSHFQN